MVRLSRLGGRGIAPRLLRVRHRAVRLRNLRACFGPAGLAWREGSLLRDVTDVGGDRRGGPEQFDRDRAHRCGRGLSDRRFAMTLRQFRWTAAIVACLVLVSGCGSRVGRAEVAAALDGAVVPPAPTS